MNPVFYEISLLYHFRMANVCKPVNTVLKVSNHYHSQKLQWYFIGRRNGKCDLLTWLESYETDYLNNVVVLL